MDRKIYYEKRGSRYYPVSEEFIGFPREGVWIVSKIGCQDRRHWSGYWVMRLGDTPTVSTVAAFQRHQDAIASAIGRVQGWTSRSPMDMAKEVLKAVIEAEEGLGK